MGASVYTHEQPGFRHLHWYEECKFLYTCHLRRRAYPADRSVSNGQHHNRATVGARQKRTRVLSLCLQASATSDSVAAYCGSTDRFGTDIVQGRREPFLYNNEAG